MFEGELGSLRKAALPLAAAIGGMVLPAAIFATLNLGRAGAAGWAVPMATDIAFAVGVLTLLGSRVSPTLRVLLLALAVIDDIGAAGVVLGGADLSGDSLWLFVGIVIGLALGKPLGIAAFSIGASRLHLATRAEDATKRGMLLVGIVGGIGFTMSLFIAQLAFPPGPLLDTAKLAILAGSSIAIVLGLAFGLSATTSLLTSSARSLR